MKWKSVLFLAGLAFLAGCRSDPNPYGYLDEYGFTYDHAQYPVPGLTPAEYDRIARMPTATPTELLRGEIPPPTPAAAATKPIQPAPPGELLPSPSTPAGPGATQ